MINAKQLYNDYKKSNFVENFSLTSENLEYITDVLMMTNHIKKEDCKEIMGSYGYCDLLVPHKGKIYKIVIDVEEECLKLLERNSACNVKQLEKYHLVRQAGEDGKFKGINCWYDIMKYISIKGVK